MSSAPLLDALSREAAAVLDDLARGTWCPSALEKALAEAVAHTG
jgi:hypothetical protein